MVLLGQLPPTQMGHSSHHMCDKLPENKIRKLITSIWLENDGQDADWQREACLADNFHHMTLKRRQFWWGWGQGRGARRQGNAVCWRKGFGCDSKPG